LLAVPSLRRLSLARSHLPSESASRILYAMAKKIEGANSPPLLVVLDLDGNNLKSPDVQRALVSCVAFNSHLKEIDFAGNDVGDVRGLVQACQLNSTLHIMRHALTIESLLSRNRFSWRANEEEVGPLARSAYGDDGDNKHPMGEGHDLFVLFSAPLCWRDHDGKLKPLDRLDHEAERELLLQSFAEAQARVGSAPGVHFDFGTTDSLMSVLTRRFVLFFSWFLVLDIESNADWC